MQERITEIAAAAEKLSAALEEDKKQLASCNDWYDELVEYVSREKEIKDAKEGEILSLNAQEDEVSENIFLRQRPAFPRWKIGSAFIKTSRTILKTINSPSKN